jgi:hypothetical protein
MQLREKYSTLDRVLWGIREQIIDSVEYVKNNFPPLNTPDEVFNYCKMISTYVPDPPDVELVQSVPTLLENNQNGVIGGGDCDDLTVLTIAACIANNLKPNYIFLCGRNKSNAVHIYSGVKYDGKIYTLDLTNQFINMERPYQYCQILEI